ncbi:transglutaminase family protein [Agrococcus sp. ARC_14]|uniref:transglutaminase-like domain-containing protein n=1 Tax=Agrococcus sp. ARC_14 TaxID=2919927 RepID=UPI001F068B61|nr:transglutaminase family protein [Agrococcus sp. ARC_14]MCH1883722.1 transglutaminase family protein [Agrococcus sp. ARC_14]
MRTARAAFSMSLVGDTEFVLLALPAAAYASDDRISISVDGSPVEWSILPAAHDTRQVVFTAPAGTLDVDIRSTLTSLQRPVDDSDVERYLADSRYIEASALRGFVDERFGRATGFEAVGAMRNWIARGFSYSPALSAIDDTAVMTLEKGGGMCRDYAHVMIALARAAGIPARYVGVYAPGLVPPDFHAVAEVHIDGDWWVVDPTGLAPRGSLIRIATGADALETAWATTAGNPVRLTRLTVEAGDDSLIAGATDEPRMRYRIL